MTEYYIIKIILYILIATAGFILGHFILPPGDKPSGELIIDTSNPHKDKWLFKLNEPTEKTAGRSMVTLKVCHRRITEGEPEWPSEI